MDAEAYPRERLGVGNTHASATFSCASRGAIRRWKVADARHRFSRRMNILIPRFYDPGALSGSIVLLL